MDGLWNTELSGCSCWPMELPRRPLWNQFKRDHCRKRPQYLGVGILPRRRHTSPSATVVAGGYTYNMGALCPSGSCDQVRTGYMSTVLQSSSNAVAIDPPFAGIAESVIQIRWTLIPARATKDGVWMRGPWMAARVLVRSHRSTGQLWKISGAQSNLHRKTPRDHGLCRAGSVSRCKRSGSLIGNGVQDSYKYCYALTAGECQPGSAAGDVYVNAPYVNYPYCYYPGIAISGDDTNSICIGDLGAYTGNLAQLGLYPGRCGGRWNPSAGAELCEVESV